MIDLETAFQGAGMAALTFRMGMRFPRSTAYGVAPHSPSGRFHPPPSAL